MVRNRILQSLLSSWLQTARDITGNYVSILDFLDIRVWLDKPFEGSGIPGGRPPHPPEIRDSKRLRSVRP